MKDISYFQHHPSHSSRSTPSLNTTPITRKWYNINFHSPYIKYLLPLSLLGFIMCYNQEYLRWEWNQFQTSRRKRQRFLANNAYYQKYQTRPPGYAGSLQELFEQREPVGFLRRVLFQIKLFIMKHESKLDPYLNTGNDIENRMKAYESLLKKRQ
ncbi:hypothetical protein C9374_001679 [Naegleria lovaniensis]|uniref:Uncharacterized protein n=1 Tax=Naegleria lovaniensis TaxID=51637 RepID=A0AA88GUP0_NAELO|nr:uncharacterized protein C9374_001679 [Naegleria lovaniensis]KAG2387347.1 hypothetical protein C9374_001679 [Naegleria lovaniensis]